MLGLHPKTADKNLDIHIYKVFQVQQSFKNFLLFEPRWVTLVLGSGPQIEMPLSQLPPGGGGEPLGVLRTPGSRSGRG